MWANNIGFQQTALQRYMNIVFKIIVSREMSNIFDENY